MANVVVNRFNYDQNDHGLKTKDIVHLYEEISSANRANNGRNNISGMKKQISVYDIFSGADNDSDIPPIEADIEEEGVYRRDDVSLYGNTPTIIAPLSEQSNDNECIDKKKTEPRSPSYAERKSQLKKGSVHFKTIASDSDVEKENDGVIIRMKNQETYYDGRPKYKSLLPEAPMYQIFDNKNARRSVFAQKAMGKSLDLDDANIRPGKRPVNSIMLPYVALPPMDDNDIIIDKICQEEDDSSNELEPLEESDTYSGIRVSQLMNDGPQRITWAETEEGKKLIRMKNLSSDIIKWQEAQFEVITSEASYYRSLEILVNDIYKSPYMICKEEKKPNDDIKAVMTALQKHHLFSNILEIHICSGELLKALETRWRENAFIEDLSDILVEFSKEKLRPYITYLRNQQYQSSTYNQLLTQTEFQNAIRDIEAGMFNGIMNLSSFLLLPMQRMLRLKLLFLTVKKYIPPTYPTQGCETALTSLEALIRECSDQKMLMEQKEEILLIYNRLSFKQQTGVSIGSRPLLKEGQLKITAGNSNASKAIKSNGANNKAQMYLFEDQLIISKAKKPTMCMSSGSNDRETVVDICPRSDVKFESCQNSKLFIFKNSPNLVFKLVLTKGLKGCAEYVCEADSSKSFEEWENVLVPGTNDWEHLDFNDALVIKDFSANSAKELDLKRGQILCILKIINDRVAIASLGDKHGEIPLSHVQFVSTPPPDSNIMIGFRSPTPITTDISDNQVT